MLINDTNAKYAKKRQSKLVSEARRALARKRKRVKILSGQIYALKRWIIAHETMRKYC